MTLRRRSALIEYRQRRTEEREASFRALAATKGRAAVYGGETAADPKPEARYVDKALTDMAKDRPCLLLVPDCCNHRTDTTVACHSNLMEHGKGAGRKADDEYSAWGCAGCHSWLDQGKAAARLKRAVFMAAHARQVLAWRQIATDPSEPERFRNAAKRALERLNAGPVVEI